MKKTMGLVCLLLSLWLNAEAQSMTDKLDELMQAYTKNKEFSGSVLIAKQGIILLEKGYGLKNIKEQSMNDSHTIFPIASVTKTFTSTLILKLAEMNKLSLQDKLSKYYPDYPHGDSITIENLLMHTSGIYNYTQNNDFMFSKATKPANEAIMLGLFKDKPLDFVPGTGWRYSNSGYSLLGYIIEKVTKMRYDQAMRYYIFKPLQMNQSGFDFAHLNLTKRAIGYYSDSGKEYIKEAPMVDSSVHSAAGAIYSTVGDLYQWHKGLQSYQILSKPFLEKATTPFKNNYGYGWIIDSMDHKKIVSHSGGLWGFRSNFARVVEDDICIILFSNIETPGLEHVTKKLLTVLYEKPYQLPIKKQAIKLSEEALNAYVGTYEIEEQKLIIEIKIEQGNLVSYPENGPRSEMLALSDGHFFLSEEEEFEVKFEKDNTGKVSKLVLNFSGKVREGKKIN